MFLVGEQVCSFDDDVCCFPPCVHVSLADLVAVVGVRRLTILRVDERRSGCICRRDIWHQGELLPDDVECLSSCERGLSRLRYDNRNGVRFPPRHIRWHERLPGPIDSDEDRLVEYRQAVLVHGNVGGGEDLDDSLCVECAVRIHRGHPGVRFVREDHHEHQGTRNWQVSGVSRRSGDLCPRIFLDDRCPDGHDDTFPAISRASTIDVYPVHLQMFPPRPSLISSSVRFSCSVINDEALITNPGVQ